MDLAKLLLSGKYTDEEIVFNNLDKEAMSIMRKVKADINKIISMLKTYGFKRKEVEEIILNKLKENEND